MKKRILRTILPCLGFGAVTGIGTAGVVVLYKYVAGKTIHLSEGGYAYLREHLWALPIALILLVAVAWLLCHLYRRHPDLQGSGIPSSIAAQRGLIRIPWLKNLVGTFLLSLSNFLLGVPLGTEGPAVMMGTAIGQGTTRPKNNEHNAWARYAMTGGACAGFSPSFFPVPNLVTNISHPPDLPGYSWTNILSFPASNPVCARASSRMHRNALLVGPLSLSIVSQSRL